MVRVPSTVGIAPVNELKLKSIYLEFNAIQSDTTIPRFEIVPKTYHYNAPQHKRRRHKIHLDNIHTQTDPYASFVDVIVEGKVELRVFLLIASQLLTTTP